MMHCSFCGKPHTEVFYLISCPKGHIVSVYICDECVWVCNQILHDVQTEEHQIPFYEELANSLFPK